MSGKAKDFAEAFTIFAKYEEDGYIETAAEHDIIYSGPTVVNTTPEDAARLRDLGWFEDEYDGWAKFV